jgi:uncharacterized membrane protein YeiB
LQDNARYISLDALRGFAVMGILAMNIVAFAMPEWAYIAPLAYGGDGVADKISWLFSFIFIDGKMRGLFSLLFGASMALIIERAEAARAKPAKVTLCADVLAAAIRPRPLSLHLVGRHIVPLRRNRLHRLPFRNWEA